MSISNATIAAFPVRTPAILLAAVEEAIVNVLLTGKHYGINGRTLTREDLSELRKMREALATEVIVVADTSGGVSLGSFHDPV